MNRRPLVWFAVLALTIPATGARPGDGVYNPTISSEFVQKGGAVYPAAVALRPWKPAQPSEFAGRFVDIADPTSSVTLRVEKRKLRDGFEWEADGEWKLPGQANPARIISWTGSCLELGSKHSYIYGARGSFFLFFVRYNDPDVKHGEPRGALLIGDRVLVRE